MHPAPGSAYPLEFLATVGGADVYRAKPPTRELFVIHTPGVTRRGFFTPDAVSRGLTPDDPEPLREAIQFVINLLSL